MSPAAQLSSFPHFTMPYYFGHSGAHSNAARAASSGHRRHRTRGGGGGGASGSSGHRGAAASVSADSENFVRQRPHSSRTRRETIATSSESTAIFGERLDCTISACDNEL